MVYPDPSPALNTVEVVDLGKEEEVQEMAKPAEGEPGPVEEDPVEVRVASEELDLLGPRKQPTETIVEEDVEMETNEEKEEEEVARAPRISQRHPLQPHDLGSPLRNDFERASGSGSSSRGTGSIPGWRRKDLPPRRRQGSRWTRSSLVYLRIILVYKLSG